jgi:hypothetical protein
MNPIDAYIGKLLKSLAARQRPPVNGRTRLLKAASASNLSHLPKNKLSQEHLPIVWKRTYDSYRSSDWSLHYFDLSSIYSLGVLNMRHVI